MSKGNYSNMRRVCEARFIHRALFSLSLVLFHFVLCFFQNIMKFYTNSICFLNSPPLSLSLKFSICVNAYGMVEVEISTKFFFL